MIRHELSSACLLMAAAGLALLPMGCKKTPPITLSANATPPVVFPGESVTVTATPGSVSTKKNNNLIYSWTGTGATGNGTSTTIQTASLDPGNYTVKAEVKQGKKGKEGQKPGESAEASASFRVKPFEPPTIGCVVVPTTIKPGDSATVTSTSISPQNRPLTYSYSATGGSISGSGTTATYSSNGAATGVVGISCNVADDKSHTASANTNLTIVAPPPPPPPPQTSKLCSISFATDKRRPTRVNNEAKACLDEVALDLQRQADAKAVIVGEANAKENEITAKQQKAGAKHKKAKVTQFAAQRAVNAKDYLVKDKGIDASRISVATGSADAQAAENYLVPSGATFSSDVPGTTPFLESTVKVEGRNASGR